MRAGAGGMASGLSVRRVLIACVAAVVLFAGLVNVGAANARGSTNPLMIYHLGPIMPTVVTKAIYWGKSWANSGFVGDRITGLDTFYTGFSNSHYARTSGEYIGTNGLVGATTTYLGHVIDLSPAPADLVEWAIPALA